MRIPDRGASASSSRRIFLFVSLAPLRRVFLFALINFLAGCSLFEPAPVSIRFKTMGTEASLTVSGRDAAQISEAERRVKGVMARLEAELSVYRTDSVISRLNDLAGVKPLEVPPDTLSLLQLSKHYGELTDGAFDVTVGPVLRLWRFGRGQPVSVPSAQAITEKLKLVDYRQIQLTENTAFLSRSGMNVDLGGIGKGYAVDVAWEECRRLGVGSFMIDLSGNIRAYDQEGTEWRIDIRNPFDKSATVGEVLLPVGWGVASSGQYERYVEIDGRRYGHIIDPRTGYPAIGLAGVTILAPDATMADALSTSLFVMGPKAGLEVLKKTKAEAILVPDKDPIELWVTPGIQGRISVPGNIRVENLADHWN